MTHVWTARGATSHEAWMFHSTPNNTLTQYFLFFFARTQFEKAFAFNLAHVISAEISMTEQFRNVSHWNTAAPVWPDNQIQINRKLFQSALKTRFQVANIWTYIMLRKITWRLKLSHVSDPTGSYFCERLDFSEVPQCLCLVNRDQPSTVQLHWTNSTSRPSLSNFQWYFQIISALPITVWPIAWCISPAWAAALFKRIIKRLLNWNPNGGQGDSRGH